MSHHTSHFHRILLSVAVLCLVGYAFFNSRFLLKGPEIVLADVDQSNIVHTDSKDFSLQGTVKHSSYITLNNRPIMVDEEGNFNEKLLLSNGVSIIDLYARDKFGKETREKIDVVYAGESNATTTEDYATIALRAQETSSSTQAVPEDESSHELTATSTIDAPSATTTATSSEH
jgi:hypothetical protein